MFIHQSWWRLDISVPRSISLLFFSPGNLSTLRAPLPWQLSRLRRTLGKWLLLVPQWTHALASVCEAYAVLHTFLREGGRASASGRPCSASLFLRSPFLVLLGDDFLKMCSFSACLCGYTFMHRSTEFYWIYTFSAWRWTRNSQCLTVASLPIIQELCLCVQTLLPASLQPVSVANDADQSSFVCFQRRAAA